MLIGSIFYHKHRIMKDAKVGDFDKEEAERLLREEEDISSRTGNPRIVDVCCSFPRAFEKLIAFVANTIDGPFAIDGAIPDVRIAGAKYVGEVGLAKRAIYNSITPYVKEEELSAIKEAKIKSSILLTLNTKNPTLTGRLQVLDKLIAIAQKAGVKNMLVDTTVLDVPDPGPVSKVVHYVKRNYGLPAGAGTHNAVDRWIRIRGLNRTQRLLASCAVNIFPIVMGADFVLYGPIEHALKAYFCCALADAYCAYSMKQEFRMRPSARNHPLFKIFKI